jgi:beta-lactamase class A
VDLLAEVSHDSPVAVHLGANFPLTVISRGTSPRSQYWYEVRWRTPGRTGTGWLPAWQVTTTKPSAPATAGIEMLDEPLARYLASFGTKVGVDVYDVTRGMTYTYNADRPYFVASSIKVPIMVALLSQLEARKRKPNAHELSLLTTMIEYSNNKSAEELYVEAGWQRGINAVLRKAHVPLLVDPPRPTMPYGYSGMTPAGMVALLTRLHEGTILNQEDRDLALRLMRHVTPSQRIGVGDSSPAGATVSMKDGWITAPSPGGPAVVNSSGIVTLGSETYIISVYTDRDRNYDVGFAIVRHVCKVVGQRLTAKTEAAEPTA